MELLASTVMRPALLAVTRHAVKQTVSVNVNRATRVIGTAFVNKVGVLHLYKLIPINNSAIDCSLTIVVFYYLSFMGKKYVV